jgi:hypothetical protein
MALYGLNVAGIYWLGSRLLAWDLKMCSVAAEFFKSFSKKLKLRTQYTLTDLSH